jgi:hypothetical protein
MTASMPGLVFSIERGDASFIAGTTPDQRPKGAPVIREFTKPAGWYDHALKGIMPPYPYSLRFLEDEGAWYTPFNHPGTTGRYDIRGLVPR